jgi:Cdc6-like AAA superfamily ATPase
MSAMPISYLDSDPNPSRVAPYRKKELQLLSQLFIGIISDSSPPCRKVLIVGEPGIYKTETVQSHIKSLEIAAEATKVKFNSLYLDGRESFMWGYHLHNNWSLKKMPLNVRFILILDHLEHVSFSRLKKMLNIIEGQKISVIGIISEENKQILQFLLTEPTHYWDQIKFSSYTNSQILTTLRSYRRERPVYTQNSNKVFPKIVSHSHGSLKRALLILHEAEKIALQTSHRTVNEEIINLLLDDFSLEWRPVNLLPEDVVGY